MLYGDVGTDVTVVRWDFEFSSDLCSFGIPDRLSS